MAQAQRSFVARASDFVLVTLGARPAPSSNGNHELKHAIAKAPPLKRLAEMIVATPAAGDKGCNMEYSQFSPSLPEWKSTRRVPARTEQDDAFFKQIENDAQLAEQTIGKALHVKYGEKIPLYRESNDSGIDPEKIANALGANILKR